ncbi:hypothetical protein KR067_000884, partial [Drosophila pandora]
HTWMPKDYWSWPPSSKNTVFGGKDLVSDLVVGRRKVNAEIVPARIRIEGTAGIARYNGQNHAGTICNGYDFLVATEGVTFEWIKSENGRLEPGAVAAGTNEHGESVIVCRGPTTSGVIIGFLYPSKGLCYIWPEHKPMVRLSEYEVLVSNKETT